MVIDVRDADFEGGHIKGAVNIGALLQNNIKNAAARMRWRGSHSRSLHPRSLFLALAPSSSPFTFAVAAQFQQDSVVDRVVSRFCRGMDTVIVHCFLSQERGERESAWAEREARGSRTQPLVPHPCPTPSPAPLPLPGPYCAQRLAERLEAQGCSEPEICVMAGTTRRATGCAISMRVLLWWARRSHQTWLLWWALPCAPRHQTLPTHATAFSAPTSRPLRTRRLEAVSA